MIRSTDTGERNWTWKQQNEHYFYLNQDPLSEVIFTRSSLLYGEYDIKVFDNEFNDVKKRAKPAQFLNEQ